ncbi:methyltransferase domain-containing protein [Streptomyces sp. N2-109]|uniref:Trans-aconitate 2-methyltransferase n=1 Tax=Streptomyces gossypii TaxID=2883101 RepID=A0ABT2JYR0_9ACTN|nr:methyltransferase domain-containing protein [Streptomyces gossypii]MCT2593033.1 methyltransferase domain-containing protein [Streptomyces gossypii]
MTSGISPGTGSGSGISPGTGSAPVWDPQQYGHYAEDRGRPRRELLARVPALPASASGGPGPRIADLGCGSGGPSAELAARWPAAHVTGYDNSATMLAEARAYEGPTAGGGTLDFAHADLATWRPPPAETFDLIFSNAAFQWLPGHTAAFPGYMAALAPGGVFAFQVPGNFAAPSHTLLHALRDSPRWSARLGREPERVPVPEPAGYFAALAPLGRTVDTWETTYTHVLTGEDPVLEWVKGTALRPVLTLLADDPEARDAFLAEYAAALREAYPPGPYGTLFPFRRIFAVAVKQ